MATQSKRRKKKNKTTLWIIGGLAVVLVALVVAGNFNKKDLLEVEVEKAEVRTVYSRVSESGMIQPTIEVPVASDVSGEVVDLYVKEGMKVKKGDLLVTIRPDNYKAALEQSQAALNQAKAGELQAKASAKQARATMLQDSVAVARAKGLFAENVISKVELENAELKYKVSRSQFEAASFSTRAAYYQVQSATASVTQARQSLDRTNIYASMDGTLTKLNVELGQRVVGTMQMAGTEVLRVADLSSMEVVVEISENDIVNVNLGDSTRIEVDAFPDQVFFGKVSEIAYSANVAGLGSTDQVTNFEVKVNISPSSYGSGGALNLGNELASNESPFRPGMTALIEIFTEWEKDAITVPIQAVTLTKKEKEEDEKTSTKVVDKAKKKEKPQEVVYVVNNGLAREIPVATSISDDSHIVIKNGVKEGDEVVIGSYTVLTKQLEDSTEVEIKKDFGSKGKRGWRKK